MIFRYSLSTFFAVNHILCTKASFVNRYHNCHSLKREQELRSFSETNEGVPSSWGTGDDWSNLSTTEPNSNNEPLTFFSDRAREVAKSIELQVKNDAKSNVKEFVESDEDKFVSDAVDTIYETIVDPNGPALFDTKTFESYIESDDFTDTLAKEVGLLIRCNESPDDMLVEEGRALPALKDEDKYNVHQLVVKKIDGNKDSLEGIYEPTPFFSNALSKMFYSYVGVSESGKKEGTLFLTKELVAKWMSKSLGVRVGTYDKRINFVMARYGTKGTINEDQFQFLYMEAVTGDLVDDVESCNRKKSLGRLKIEQATSMSVWRDLENHGFSPPIVEERQKMQNRIDAEVGMDSKDSTRIDELTLMDECEILEWGDGEHSNPRSRSRSQMTGASLDTKKSSHESVELCSDKKTPKRLRDGDFIFIDEDSCIGCNECVNSAPTTFVMETSGRARTFRQSNTPEVSLAVSTCPVSCMHKVSFDELKKMETFRDIDSLGSGSHHTPLHVTRRNDGLNRKKSDFHYLKQKCYFSKECPQKGCYVCPMYQNPGENPIFQEKQRAADKIRARDIVESGEMDSWRNTVEL